MVILLTPPQIRYTINGWVVYVPNFKAMDESEVKFCSILEKFLD